MQRGESNLLFDELKEYFQGKKKYTFKTLDPLWSEAVIKELNTQFEDIHKYYLVCIPIAEAEDRVAMLIKKK